MELVILKAKQKGHKSYTKVSHGKTISVKQKGQVNLGRKQYEGFVSSKTKINPNEPVRYKTTKKGTQAEMLPKWHDDLRAEIKGYDKDNNANVYPTKFIVPGTVQINPKILAEKNIYQRALEEYKKNGKSKLYDYLVNTPFVRWQDSRDKEWKKHYPAGAMTVKSKIKTALISKSMDNLDEAVETMQKQFMKDGVDSDKGVIALMGLLSNEFNFRIGTEGEKGVGLTTMKPSHIKFDMEEESASFVFTGKSGVKWKKKLMPDSKLHEKMLSGLWQLSEGAKEAGIDRLFWNEFGEPITAGRCNRALKEMVGRDDITWHSFRHAKANKIMATFMADFKQTDDYKKIMKLEGKKRYQLVNSIYKTQLERMSAELNDKPATVQKRYLSHDTQAKYWKLFGYEYDFNKVAVVNPFRKPKGEK